jgi:hypothetical protein
VKTGGLVFVKTSTGFEQRPPARLPDGPDHLGVRVGAGGDDFHPHPALQSFHDRAAAEVVRDEIGVGNADVLASGGDRNEQHQPRAVRAFAGGTLEGVTKTLPGRLELRKVSVAVEQLGARLEPIVDERLLQLRDRRAFDLIMRVAPQTARPAVALPVISNADSTDESELAVHHQDFAMRPKIDGRKMDEAKDLHAYA